LVHNRSELLPAEGVEFVFGADKFHRSIIQKHTAAFGVVFVEGKKLTDTSQLL